MIVDDRLADGRSGACLVTTLVLAALTLWAMLVVAGGTPMGRLMRRHLVERPAEGLLRIPRAYVAVAVVVSALLAALVLSGGGDGVRMLGMGAPDAAVWLTTLEFGSWLDVVMGVAIAATAIRVRPLLSLLRAWLMRCRASGRRPRDRSARLRRRDASNDDGDVHDGPSRPERWEIPMPRTWMIRP